MNIDQALVTTIATVKICLTVEISVLRARCNQQRPGGHVISDQRVDDRVPRIKTKKLLLANVLLGHKCESTPTRMDWRFGHIEILLPGSHASRRFGLAEILVPGSRASNKLNAQAICYRSES